MIVCVVVFEFLSWLQTDSLNELNSLPIGLQILQKVNRETINQIIGRVLYCFSLQIVMKVENGIKFNRYLCFKIIYINNIYKEECLRSILVRDLVYIFGFSLLPPPPFFNKRRLMRAPCCLCIPPIVARQWLSKYVPRPLLGNRSVNMFLGCCWAMAQ
jgi:hypothetical protein